MMDYEAAEASTVPFPVSLSSIGELTEDALIDIVWSTLCLEDLHKPFRLPTFSPRFDSVAAFVETELKLQVEMWRSELHMKVNRVANEPKPETENSKAEKHIHFPYRGSSGSHQLFIDFHTIHKEPPRGQFTNYVVLLQKRRSDGSGAMEDLTLGYTKFVRKRDGALIVLGADYENLRERAPPGTKIFVRCLKNASMPKTHLRAIAALKNAEKDLKNSYVTRQLLEGRINEKDIHSTEELDRWVNSKPDSSCSFNLQDFNEQQQRALALDALTPQGIVLVQGPPGTGKSHTICNGLIPQLVERNEKVLLVCNSNVAVDALMLKCTKIDSLRGRIIRCGHKTHVSDEIVDMNLYAEGDVLGNIGDRYGNFFGSNSNTADAHVQNQIRSSRVVFTTIHFASKEKDKATSSTERYWDFDTLVLDEAAQIEDSRLFIVLARCQTLKKMILVGDPKQIQPYVPDSLRKQNYGQSTMERIMGPSTGTTGGNGSYVMLEEQFRMAPLLRQIVSHLYYNDQLIDNPNVEGRGPRENLKVKPLLVVNLTGTSMSFNRLHQSYENKAEAEVCKYIYNFLFSSDFEGVLPGLADSESDLTAKDVCILTPYNQHKDQLRMRICDVDEDDLDAYGGTVYGTGGRIHHSSGASVVGSPTKGQALYGTEEHVPEQSAASIESIDTVDKFQGSERKVVMISTCVDRRPLRAADPHFINVACSRAQHLLIVVGNFSVALSPSKDWFYVWKKAKELGSYFEHRVTEAGDGFDIQEVELKSKLCEMFQSSKRQKRA